jgi:hypothetical protein
VQVQAASKLHGLVTTCLVVIININAGVNNIIEKVEGDVAVGAFHLHNDRIPNRSARLTANLTVVAHGRALTVQALIVNNMPLAFNITVPVDACV